jgi:hypothetical protein
MEIEKFYTDGWDGQFVVMFDEDGHVIRWGQIIEGLADMRTDKLALVEQTIRTQQWMEVR